MEGPGNRRPNERGDDMRGRIEGKCEDPVLEGGRVRHDDLEYIRKSADADLEYDLDQILSVQ